MLENVTGATIYLSGEAVVRGRPALGIYVAVEILAGYTTSLLLRCQAADDTINTLRLQYDLSAVASGLGSEL